MTRNLARFRSRRISSHVHTLHKSYLLLYLTVQVYSNWRDLSPDVDLPNYLRNRKHVPCFYQVLYNNPSYSCILIGSRL